jgi:hypothetical protein
MHSKLEPSSLNNAFLKYFPISQTEKKSFLQKKEFCFGERILIHYEIEPLPKLALEFERVIFDALFSSKSNRTEVTPDWIGDLFFTENPGYSLSGAMFSLCLKDGIKEIRNFIEVVDYLGICWSFINYWTLHRKAKEEAFSRNVRNTFIFLSDEETSPIFKISESQFQEWKKALKLPSVNSRITKQESQPIKPFLGGDERLMSDLKSDDLTKILVKAYGGMVWKSSKGKVKVTIDEIAKSDDLNTILDLIEKFYVGDKKEIRSMKSEDSICRWLSKVNPSPPKKKK